MEIVFFFIKSGKSFDENRGTSVNFVFFVFRTILMRSTHFITHVEQVRWSGRQVSTALNDPCERDDQQWYDLEETAELPAGRGPVRSL